MNDRLADTGAVATGVGLVATWLDAVKGPLEVILLLVSIFAGVASGLYYVTKWLNEKSNR